MGYLNLYRSVRTPWDDANVLARTHSSNPHSPRRSEIVAMLARTAKLSSDPLTATVSGSFRRAMAAVTGAVYALTDAGVRVLSPADPRIVDQFGDFVFVASDRARAIRLVQSRHLAAIDASDFVWLVAPEGYIGQSAAMELGFAVAVRTPVYCSEVPIDLTLRQYVTIAPTVLDAVRAARSGNCRAAPSTNVLLEPGSAIEAGHGELERIATELTVQRDPLSSAAVQAARRLKCHVTDPLLAR